MLPNSDLRSPTSGIGTRVAFAEHCAVALFNMEGTLFAIDDLFVRCGSSLVDGKLHGSIVACCGCDRRDDVRPVA